MDGHSPPNLPITRTRQTFNARHSHGIVINPYFVYTTNVGTYEMNVAENRFASMFIILSRFVVPTTNIPTIYTLLLLLN